MIKIPITTPIFIDEKRPVADQLNASSDEVDYSPDDDDQEFLGEIAGLLWKDLTNDQKMQVIEWLVANMVYEGTVSFDYTYTCPGHRGCPVCHKPMDIFDEPEETGPRYVCHHCKHIVTITPLEE